MRGRGALSSGSTRGAREAGAEPSGAKGCGFESFRELPISRFSTILKAQKQKRRNRRNEAQSHAFQVLVAPPWIAPQLRAQGHVKAQRQKVLPIRGHAAKDCLAVRQDAAARRKWLAAGGAGAAEVLDLL